MPSTANDSQSNQTKRRKTFKPKGITCPEGVWSIEAAFLLDRKSYEEGADKGSIGEAVKNLIEALVLNPEIEVFTIESNSGHKSIINRDYLRGQRSKKDFVRGSILSDNIYAGEDEGKYIFVNKDHFDKYLNDEPIFIEDDNAKSDEKPLAQNTQDTISERERSSYLTIIGALLGLFLGKTSSDVPLSQFKTQQAIIDCIHATYGEKSGLSKRNLEDKFAKAKEKTPPKLS